MSRGGAVFFALLLTLVAVGAERTVPFGEAKSFTLTAKPGDRLLAVGGYFRTPMRFFRYRTCVVTCNGQVLDSARLRSPEMIIMPRHPQPSEMPRFDDRNGGLRFPLTHRDGGLADYTWSDGNEYDKWVKLYHNFPQTVYFAVGDLLPAGGGPVTVRIFNNLEGPNWIAKEEVKPPLVVTELALLKDRPETDDYGPYIAPIWNYLDAHPEARRVAAGKLRDPATAPEVKAQILAQLGMLNQMRGYLDTAIDLYRRSVAASTEIPEYPEMCYRLLQLTGEAAVESLPEPETSSGRWARLYNAYKRALAGEKEEMVYTVAWNAEALSVDGQAKEAVWTAPSTAWRPMPFQQLGPDPVEGMTPNAFAMVYDETHLKLLFRGPGAPGLQEKDVPTTVDHNAWDYNCVELFLTPQAAFTRYYELNVSAANGRYDSRMLWDGVVDPGRDFVGSWTTGTAISGEGFCVEYAVPWSDFGLAGPPAAGELWVGNVIRVQFTPDEEGKWVQREFSAGNLLWRSFHRLQDGLIFRFGERGE